MNVAPLGTTPVVTVPTTPESSTLQLASKNLGSIGTTFGGTCYVGTGVRANGTAGAADGYASLADAQTALSRLSAGPHNGAIAIIAQGDRFYGEHVVGVNEINGRPGRVVRFGGLQPTGLARTFSAANANVVSLVDGGSQLLAASTPA